MQPHVGSRRRSAIGSDRIIHIISRSQSVSAIASATHSGSHNNSHSIRPSDGNRHRHNLTRSPIIRFSRRGSGCGGGDRRGGFRRLTGQQLW